MKKVFLGLSILLLSSCMHGVEQDVTTDDPAQNKLLCNCSACVETIIWYQTDIVEAYYDHPDSIKSIALHKKQADSLYKHLNQY